MYRFTRKALKTISQTKKKLSKFLFFFSKKSTQIIKYTCSFLLTGTKGTCAALFHYGLRFVTMVSALCKGIFHAAAHPSHPGAKKVNYVLYAFFLWFMACFFYGFEFLHRLIPALIAGEISKDLALQAGQLGSITAYYFYAYAFAQLPAGLLIDHYGIRRTLTVASLCVAVGSALLSGASDVVVASFSRALIGFGSGFAFAGTLKVLSLYFSASVFAFFVGMTNSVGILVATFGQIPFAHFVSSSTWREALLALGGIGAVLTLVLWIVFQGSDEKEKTLREEGVSFSETLLYVVKQPQIWWYSLIAAMRVTPIISFAELWAGPFLSSCYHADKQSITQLVTSIFLGIAAGGPLFGLLSRFILRRHLLLIGGLFSLFITSTLLTGIAMNRVVLTSLLVGLGVSSSSMLLCFGLCVERVPAWAKGAAIGFMNMWITFYGAALLPVIGYLLQWQNPGCALDYSLRQYQGALLIVPVSLVISLLMTLALSHPYFAPAETKQS